MNRRKGSKKPTYLDGNRPKIRFPLNNVMLSPGGNGGGTPKKGQVSPDVNEEIYFSVEKCAHAEGGYGFGSIATQNSNSKVIWMALQFLINALGTSGEVGTQTENGTPSMFFLSWR